MAEELDQERGFGMSRDKSDRPPPGTFLSQKTGLNTSDVYKLVNALKAGWPWAKACRLLDNVEVQVLVNWKDECHRMAGLAKAAPAHVAAPVAKAKRAKAEPLIVASSSAPAPKRAAKSRKAR